MHQNCAECRRLRRAYDAATAIHLALEHRLQLATLGRHNEAVAALKLQIEATARKRVNAREAIQQHMCAANHQAAEIATSGAGSSQ